MLIKPQNEFTLEQSLDLGKIQTTGSILHINEHLDEADYTTESSLSERLNLDFIGHKLGSLTTLAQDMTDIHPQGFVKKKILEEGGGLPLQEPCTVSIAFSGYFDHAEEPFDVCGLRKPLEAILTMTEYEDHGLIAGLDIAIKTMLVGEVALFLLTHEVAYGEFGIPPRIPPKAQCAFFVKLVKSTLNPENRKINFKQPDMYGRVEKEVKNLYAAGSLLYQSNNFLQAANVFRKAIWMLHKCRLADETEQIKQEKWLKKLYFNSAICYNKAKLPLKACVACNELNILKNLWNNSKALFQNAKALRMIGQYDTAQKRLERAKILCSDSHYEEIVAELELLKKTKEACNQQKLIGIKLIEKHVVGEDFKKEVDTLINNFKQNPNLCQLVLPAGLGTPEIKYFREACIRENLFMKTVDVPFEREMENELSSDCDLQTAFAINKDEYQSSDEQSDVSPSTSGGKRRHENLMTEVFI